MTITKLAEPTTLLIFQKLLEFYGYPEWRRSLPPLDELISTILSQNTNDTNRDRAFLALQARFPTWENVRDAETSELIEAIRPAGLANRKGPRIQNILREITEKVGTLSLEFLSGLSIEEAKQWLMQFNGVGPKTAAIVLQFSLNLPAFPVDTHILRVTKRLGLIPEKMSAQQAHQHLGEMFTKEMYYSAHLNIIRLGREICHARKPNCPVCPLQAYCYFRKTTQQSCDIEPSYDSRLEP
jgi:endonuclease-3